MRRFLAIAITLSLACSAGAASGCISGDDDCFSHQECDTDEWCQFGIGRCVQKCVTDEDCRFWERCHGCAAASCPACRDCLSGCVPQDET